MVTESDTESKRLMRRVYQKTKESSVSEDCDTKRLKRSNLWSTDCVRPKKIYSYRSIGTPVVINWDAFSLSVQLYCGFWAAAIQADSYCIIQQTEHYSIGETYGIVKKWNRKKDYNKFCLIKMKIFLRNLQLRNSNSQRRHWLRRFCR